MMRVDRDVLVIDAAAVTDAILQALFASTRQLKRRGLIVGASGGVDSSVCLALAAQSLGADRVLAVLMPEWESDDESTIRARDLCEDLGVEYIIEHIGPTLEALGCYRRRDEAIRAVFPEYGDAYRQKIGIAGGFLDRDVVPHFNLTIESPTGERQTARMPATVFAEVTAATNMKQRTRKMVEYLHAESRNFAVVGTPNRLEYVLGFFVRGGDGLADVKPIAHLFKTQVYQLAEHLDIPLTIRTQAPTTDTYSLAQTQDEFYFGLPYEQMDLCLWAWERAAPAASTASAVGLRRDQVERVYRDIEGKRRTAVRSLADALLVEPIDLSGTQ